MKKEIIKIKKNIFLYVNIRVLFLSLVTALIYLWSLPFSFFVVHSEEFQENSVNKNANGLVSSDIWSGYSLKTKIQYCEEDKNNKRDSQLCGQSIQLEKQDELFYEKLTHLNEVKPRMQPQAQKPIMIAPRVIVRKPVVLRISCAEKNDHPSYSDTKGKHMDEDCCPDPDEWPKPGCAYSPSSRALMLKRPK
jgi:hypothetical protein